MLQFLLDEHISPRVCSIVRERRSQVLIESLLEWQGGRLRGKDDPIVLAAAAEAGYTLVTYDLRTIPALLQAWAATGLRHQGVIFIDERTYRPQDFAGIGDALIRIWDSLGTFEWTERVTFASRHPAED
jgi:Domain of unknown function (DUF5615)